MKKFPPIILCLIFLFGCQKNPLLGRWERYGDGAAGSIVEVDNKGQVCNGRLIKVGGVLNELGFYENDIKWRDIEPMAANKWKGRDLIKQLDTTGTLTNVEYKDVYFTLINNQDLEVRWFAREEEFVGTIQRWKRIQ
jgi:hypothetical protein